MVLGGTILEIKDDTSQQNGEQHKGEK